MSIDKKKLEQAIELEQAIKVGKGEFILLKKLDELEDKLEEIKPEEIEINIEII